MHVNPHLRQLISRCENLWAAEAEVFATYWTWPQRTRATDRVWVLRQMYKELHDGVVPALSKVHEGVRHVDSVDGRETFRLKLENMRQEFEHYAGFAEIYESIGADGEASASTQMIMRDGAWPENDVLMQLRADHSACFGKLGERARRFTEGGYCTLFSEGRKLAGGSELDNKIAATCERIFDDEFDHMLGGIADFIRSDSELGDAEWQTLTRLTTEQLRQRIYMRNAQFSNVIDPERLQLIVNGVCEPVSFDYERAFRHATRSNDQDRG